MRYYLHLAYKGTNYSGWQRQKNALTIQQIVEEKIGEILKEKTIVIGCGRTDAGVHASQYILHFDTKKEISHNFIFDLNHKLPTDIRVHDIQLIRGNSHAQFDATERQYDYFFHAGTTPILKPFSAFFYAEKIDLEKMEQATKLLEKYSDFEYFCKTPHKHNHTLCNIKSCTIHFSEKENQFHFQIIANRFLRGMIRILVSRIKNIGTGRLTLEEFEAFLQLKQKPKFMNFAPPEGLFLSRIKYDFIDFEPKENTTLFFDDKINFS